MDIKDFDDSVFNNIASVILSTTEEYLKKSDAPFVEQCDELYKTEFSNYNPSPFIKALRNEYKGFGNHLAYKWQKDYMLNSNTILVEMTPMEYLEHVSYEIFNAPLQPMIEHSISKSIAEKYAKEMNEGARFPIGFIDYIRKNQDGRHRALAAHLNGYDKIPVYIIK